MSEEIKYDSSADTLKHIKRVNEALGNVCKLLIDRGNKHDQSKLEEPEKSEFDRMTPLLAGLVYGSKEYRDSTREFGKALEHHYKHNSHHRQHYENGVDGMDLIDIVEMYCDWLAAGERNKDGNMLKSIEFNAKHLSPQLVNIFTNTTNRIKL